MPEPPPTNFAVIKVGTKLTAIIDIENEAEIRQYTWKPRRLHGCTYAARMHKAYNGEAIIYMHRQITKCPRKLVVHHHNKKTLDNRKCNLICCSKDSHRQYHKYGTTIPVIQNLEAYR